MSERELEEASVMNAKRKVKDARKLIEEQETLENLTWGMKRKGWRKHKTFGWVEKKGLKNLESKWKRKAKEANTCAEVERFYIVNYKYKHCYSSIDFSFA